MAGRAKASELVPDLTAHMLRVMGWNGLADGLVAGVHRGGYAHWEMLTRAARSSALGSPGAVQRRVRIPPRRWWWLPQPVPAMGDANPLHWPRGEVVVAARQLPTGPIQQYRQLLLEEDTIMVRCGVETAHDEAGST